jgi:ABC-type cobalamin/Fe3+-siderophores transport system ATPase subunit
MTQNQYDHSQLIVLPPDINDSGWPRVMLKSLRMVNFGKHKDVTVNFLPTDISTNCLVGPNGIGKTTILNAIQLLFANFNGYAKERLRALTLKNVRNYTTLEPSEIEKADFRIEGLFVVNDGREYTVVIQRDGVIKGHPDDILVNLQHYCYSATFDRELHLFQLKRNKWAKFKTLIDAVTGFSIEEDQQIFQLDSDPKWRRIMNDYVIAFNMDKGRETIGHKQCSAGERKIVRTFSALLNRPATPSIILIDNVTDHVEAGRHISVINALEETFKGSQIIVTCHSTPVQRFLPRPSRLLDMRLLNTPDELRQPWRIKIADEVNDLLLRLQSFDACGSLDDIITASQLTDSANRLVEYSKSSEAIAVNAYNELKKISIGVMSLSFNQSPLEEIIRLHGG